MIRESNIDQGINRLLAHFGPRVAAHPPAAARDLADVEELAGRLPRDLVFFLSASDGVSVHLAGSDFDARLWGTHDMLHVLRGDLTAAAGPAVIPGLLPIRGDVRGRYDCLVQDECPLHGVVLRVDAWSAERCVLATGFGVYFDALTRYLTHAFDDAGRPRRDRPLVAFDADYVTEFDADLRRLSNLPATHSWLHDLEATLSSGDDFE
ncbi:MAG: SMI1/KNR4 family protein [Phycisphaerae bacterium]|nr:SMI1/KNR4 family protein [Phycisphaerae bacterium]NUQ47593.1 SMI1/KNR4 family protein [Phycisphaerae bacterium]